MNNNSVLNYVAPPTIERFMKDNSLARWLLGPVGSGKTTGCIMELLRRAAEQRPGADGYRRTRFAIVRNTLQQLKTTVLKDIEQLLAPIIDYKVTDSTIYVRAGDIRSEWLMIPLDTAEDQKRLLSTQLTMAYVNEFREVPFSLIAPLIGRCGRYPSKAMVPGGPTFHGLIADSNMPSEDSDYYRALELDRSPKWAVFTQPGGMEPNAENVDNLPKDYYPNLMEGATEDWIDVHVHAKWGKSLSGQAVFRSSFDPVFHVSEKPLVAVPGYPLTIMQDFGRTPTALIGQVDHRGRFLILAEATSEDLGLESFIDLRLRPLMAGPRFRGLTGFAVADPAGMTKSQLNEESAFDVMRRMGIKVTAAPTNEIASRLRAVETLFLRRLPGVGEGPNTGAALLIDGPNCPNLVRALRSEYRYRRKKTGQLEDIPEKLHPWSDLADCLQYGCLAANGNVIGRMVGRSTFRQYAPPPSRLAWT